MRVAYRAAGVGQIWHKKKSPSSVIRGRVTQWTLAKCSRRMMLMIGHQKNLSHSGHWLSRCGKKMMPLVGGLCLTTDFDQMGSKMCPSLELDCAFLQESLEFPRIRRNLGSNKKERRSIFAGSSRKSGTDREGMLKNTFLFCRNPFSLAKCVFTRGLVNSSFQVLGCNFWPVVRLFRCCRCCLLYHCRCTLPPHHQHCCHRHHDARYIPGVSS
jgi:hypothetical protein